MSSADQPARIVSPSGPEALTIASTSSAACAAAADAAVVTASKAPRRPGVATGTSYAPEDAPSHHVPWEGAPTADIPMARLAAAARRRHALCRASLSARAEDALCSAVARPLRALPAASRRTAAMAWATTTAARPLASLSIRAASAASAAARRAACDWDSATTAAAVLVALLLRRAARISARAISLRRSASRRVVAARILRDDRPSADASTDGRVWASEGMGAAQGGGGGGGAAVRTKLGHPWPT